MFFLLNLSLKTGLVDDVERLKWTHTQWQKCVVTGTVFFYASVYTQQTSIAALDPTATYYPHTLIFKMLFCMAFQGNFHRIFIAMSLVGHFLSFLCVCTLYHVTILLLLLGIIFSKLYIVPLFCVVDSMLNSPEEMYVCFPVKHTHTYNTKQNFISFVRSYIIVLYYALCE